MLNTTKQGSNFMYHEVSLERLAPNLYNTIGEPDSELKDEWDLIEMLFSSDMPEQRWVVYEANRVDEHGFIETSMNNLVRVLHLPDMGMLAVRNNAGDVQWADLLAHDTLESLIDFYYNDAEAWEQRG